jgi:hypothetical protein
MGLPDNDRGRPLAGPASNVISDGDSVSISQAVDNLTRLQRDVVIDALNDARRKWWLRRAQDFERAKPVPGEYHGRATREQLRARWLWCHETAQACRNKAALIEMCREDFDAEIAAILDAEEAA